MELTFPARQNPHNSGGRVVNAGSGCQPVLFGIITAIVYYVGDSLEAAILAVHSVTALAIQTILLSGSRMVIDRTTFMAMWLYCWPSLWAGARICIPFWFLDLCHQQMPLRLSHMGMG